MGIAVPSHDTEGPYTIAVGTPLIGSSSGHGFVNGAFYEMAQLEPPKVKDLLTEDLLECTAEVLSKHTCLAHAIVYNKAQGMTISDTKIILHDLTSPYFRRAHLYVGLSRVCDGKQIFIA